MRPLLRQILLSRVSLGSELLVNGDFSGAGPPPDLFLGATIAAGKLSFPAGGEADWVPATENGATYRVVFTIDAGGFVAGTGITAGFDPGGSGATHTTPGTKTEDIAATGVDATFFITSSDSVALIDNASVKKVL